MFTQTTLTQALCALIFDWRHCECHLLFAEHVAHVFIMSHNVLALVTLLFEVKHVSSRNVAALMASLFEAHQQGFGAFISPHGLTQIDAWSTCVLISIIHDVTVPSLDCHPCQLVLAGHH